MGAVVSFFAIGIDHAKTSHNIGTLWRSANLFGAAFIFTVGARYRRQSSDTMGTPGNIPLFHFASVDDLVGHLPDACPLVGVELDERAVPLEKYAHPERCAYLLGAEDHGLSPKERARCHRLIQLPGRASMNVAAAGTVVLYDRWAWRESGWKTATGRLGRLPGRSS